MRTFRSSLITQTLAWTRHRNRCLSFVGNIHVAPRTRDHGGEQLALQRGSYHQQSWAHFGPLLRWAEDKFKEHSRADLLFITDGVCEIEEHQKVEFIRAKSRSGTRCFSVLIGSDVTDAVKQFSDKLFSLTTAPNPRDAGQILSEI